MSEKKMLITPNEENDLLAKKEEPRFLSIILKSKDKLQDAIAFGITQNHFRGKENIFLYGVILKNYQEYNSVLTKGAMDSIMDQQAGFTEEQKAARKMHWHKVYGLESTDEDYERLRKGLSSRYIQDQTEPVLPA